MSGIEAAAAVVVRSPAARAARGGTEGRRGHQKRKARAQPEPLEKPRSSWPQRVSAVRGSASAIVTRRAETLQGLGGANRRRRP